MSNSEVLVRLGSPSDLASVVDLENRCFADPWTESALRSELDHDALRCALVATCGDGVCGYLMSWRVDCQVHILNIAVDPRFRRRGVATALLRQIASLAAADKLLEITLEVRRGNKTARKFYRKFGLRQAGLRVGYYADDGEDAVIMTGLVAGVLAAE